MTPQPRIAATGFGHTYSKLLYSHLKHRLVVSQAPRPDDRLRRRLGRHDILHLSWPEHWSGVDPDDTRRTIAAVKAAGLRIVWTQHNLVPHRSQQQGAEAYALWAAAADAVIHHSSHGLERARSTYRYGPDTIHRVIAHGHWAERYANVRNTTRRQVELEEGWSPCRIRLAVIGTPRAGKSANAVIDAVVRSSRADIQLLVRVPATTRVPDDPRLIVQRTKIDIDRLHRRVLACDAIVFPYRSQRLLLTGSLFDGIGVGRAAITSEWALFDELLDGADIRYGSTSDDLLRCIETLTPAEVRRSQAAMLALQSDYRWEDSAEATLRLYRQVLGVRDSSDRLARRRSRPGR